MADIDRGDWPVIALSAAADGQLTPVQIQKIMFLLGKEIRQHLGEDFYEFSAYNYGPFSKTIYEDIEDRASRGTVQINKVLGQRWSYYSITPQGLEAGRAMLAKLDDPVRGFVQSVVDWTKSMSFSQLVGAIYNKYPETAENSIFVKK